MEELRVMKNKINYQLNLEEVGEIEAVKLIHKKT